MGCVERAETLIMVGVNEGEERYLGWMVNDVSELDLGVVKFAVLLDVEEVVEQRRVPCVIGRDGAPTR